MFSKCYNFVHYDQCHYSSVVELSVIMLSPNNAIAIVRSVVILSVIPSVVISSVNMMSAMIPCVIILIVQFQVSL